MKQESSIEYAMSREGVTIEMVIIMNRLIHLLAWQILLALVLGIILGIDLHDQAEIRDLIIINCLTQVGNIFIHMIKIIVVPIVVTTLILGMASIDNTKKLSSIRLKTIFYFESIANLMIILGITFANVFHLGQGIDIETLPVADLSMSTLQ